MFEGLEGLLIAYEGMVFFYPPSSKTVTTHSAFYEDCTQNVTQ